MSMPIGKRVTDLSSISGREPYQTILNILVLLEEPLSVPQILAILNHGKRKTENNQLYKKFENSITTLPPVAIPEIKQFEHIRRGRIYEVLKSLVDLGLVLKTSSKRKVMYALNQNFRGLIALNCVISMYHVEFLNNKVEFSRPLAEEIKRIKQLKSEPNYIDVKEALKKYPDKLSPEDVENLNKQVEKECLLSLWKDKPDFTAGFILANLKKDFRTKFDNALDEFGLKNIQNDFDFRLEVKFQKKLFYEGKF